MKLIPIFCLLALLVAGCGERGDKAIAYGNDMGESWNPSAPGQMRIAAYNLFTQDVVITAVAPGKHYELTVGPIRQRYLVLPRADYEIRVWTREWRTNGSSGRLRFLTPRLRPLYELQSGTSEPRKPDPVHFYVGKDAKGITVRITALN